MFTSHTPNNSKTKTQTKSYKSIDFTQKTITQNIKPNVSVDKPVGPAVGLGVGPAILFLFFFYCVFVLLLFRFILFFFVLHLCYIYKQKRKQKLHNTFLAKQQSQTTNTKHQTTQNKIQNKAKTQTYTQVK